MSNQLQPVRGTHDLLPEAFAQHQFVARLAQEIAARYGFHAMDTPVFEFSDVFHRAVGETSDIVSKETYSFIDRGGESLTLRPEFTAGIVRAFISNGLQQLAPFKCFYHGPAFRYERPQKGRMRQFHQIGCEVLGAPDATADIEMIALAAHILSALGLSESITLEINSIGDSESRANYREALVGYLSQYTENLSADSRIRLEKNPLRILDSKDAGDRAIIANAPTLHHYFNETSHAHFNKVKAGLDALGITYQVSEKLVRGLDYYSHTVFEFTTEKLGTQSTVLAGGRYNDLVKLMGGNDAACIGFAAGVERLVDLREVLNVQTAQKLSPAVAIIPMQEAAENEAWSIAQQLRHAGIRTDIAYKGNGKKRFERANKAGAKFAVLLGEEELARGKVSLKNLETGAQEMLTRAELIGKLSHVV